MIGSTPLCRVVLCICTDAAACGSHARAGENLLPDPAEAARADAKFLTTAPFDPEAKATDVWEKLHPYMQEKIGGREKFEAIFENGQKHAEKAGFQVHTFKVLKEPEFIETDVREYVLVYAEIVIVSDKLAECKETSWLGVREEDSDAWTYLEAMMIPGEARNEAFPDFPEGKISPVTMTVRGPREKVLAELKERERRSDETKGSPRP